MGLDHLGVHTIYLKNARKLFGRTKELIECSPDPDPREHLNGPFVSIRKVQKHQELGRLEALEERRDKLKKLIESDRRQYQCELEKMGLTLYTDTKL